MNIRIFNRTVLATALFSVFSILSMELYMPSQLSTMPSILSTKWINETDQDLTFEIPYGQGPFPTNDKLVYRINEWFDNPDISSPFTKVINFRLLGPDYEAKIKFLTDNSLSIVHVIVDSPYTKSEKTFKMSVSKRTLSDILGSYYFKITIDKNRKITVDLMLAEPEQKKKKYEKKEVALDKKDFRTDPKFRRS